MTKQKTTQNTTSSAQLSDPLKTVNVAVVTTVSVFIDYYMAFLYHMSYQPETPILAQGPSVDMVWDIQNAIS